MLRPVAVSILLTLLFSFTSVAQPNGTIAGAVSDESGAVVPNASITITNRATSFSRMVATNAEGHFSAPALPAGEYDVKAEVAGFRTLVNRTTVQTGETTQVNMSLTLGQTQEVVTVEGSTSQLNYENHEISSVIQRSSIQDLPSNGRQ